MSTKTPEYTQSDCGCYVDNTRGLYMVDRIVEFANEHGAAIVHDCDSEIDNKVMSLRERLDIKIHGCKSDSFSHCEFSNEYWDEVDDYMNENYGVNGCYWGTIEHTGDWGLWKLENEGGTE